MGSNFAVWRNTYCYNKSEEEESKSDPNLCVGERCVVTFKLENKIKVLYSTKSNDSPNIHQQNSMN